MTNSDFRPTASIENLQRRAELLCKLRNFFATHGYWEVETPLLSQDTVIDLHIEPYAVYGPAASVAEQQEPAPRWLQTSPEFCMKRLLAAGANAIFQVAKAFRFGETGPLHNDEFTLVEWYRVGHSYEQAIEFLGWLAAELLQSGPAERMSYGDAFQKWLQIDPHLATIDELYNAARRSLVGVDRDFSELREDWLDLLLSHCIQPHLGFETPLILFDFPASQAALARVRDGDPPVAERFELYGNGVELANGYHELVDADELRLRNVDVNSQRVHQGKSPLPLDSRLLAAMDSGLPACSGCALGWDRLVMLALGAEGIDEVIAFPKDRA